MNPGCPIAQSVGPARARSIERRTHPLADGFVPASFLLLDINAGVEPERKFGYVRAGAIAAGNKSCCVFLNGLEGLKNILLSCNVSRIFGGTHEYEIVVHHGVSFRALALSHKGELGSFRVHEHHIGIAAPTRV